MRKFVASLIVLGAAAAAWCASGPQTLVNEAGLAYSNTYTQNLQAYGSPQAAARNIAAQITFSSATLAAKTFLDGQVSTGSLTVVSTATLPAIQASNTITMPSTAAILGSPATAQLTINSTSGITGATITLGTPTQTLTFTNGKEWTGVSTASGTASAIATAINGVGGIVANWPGGTSAVVFASAAVVGPYANAFTIVTSTPAALTRSAATFSGGLNRALLGAQLVFNGNILLNGVQWTDVSNTSTGTAASIASLFNSFGSVKANAVGGVVYTTATAAGSAGNAFTLTASTGSGVAGLVVRGATYTGGQDSATFTLNGVTLTYGTDWTFGASTTTTTTALSIASAINAHATLSKIVSASTNAAVVSATSTSAGTTANYTFTTNTAGLTTVGMKGGAAPAWTINTSTLGLASHGFTTALPVLYATGTVAIGGLTNQTTYYVVVVDANNIKLSSTSAVAQVGNGIVLTSSATPTATHTYTLTPLTFTQGPASGKWQVSNDGTTFADLTTTLANVAVSSQTYTVSGTSTVLQDLGPIDYGYLRYNVVGPTQGGVQLKVLLNAKD